MNFEMETLGNGLRVVAVPVKGRESVSIGIWVKAGGRDETPRLSGVSHFLEHLVFKGTGTRNAKQIKESIEGVGGSMNAFTSEEYTCFLSKCSRRHFDNVFDVLADMVQNATLKHEDIEKERTVILEEIKMTQDQPSQLVDEILCEVAWPNHALGRPLAGTLESVKGLSRGDIKGYRDARYNPAHLTVVAAGGIDKKSLLNLARDRFDSASSGKQVARSSFRHTQAKPQIKIHAKKTEQTHLALALRTFPKDHADEYALEILSIILGGNMSSRLFNEVREERGLAYDIGASVRKFHETGAFTVSAGVDNHKSLETVRVILAELEKITREPVPQEELGRAKEFYLGQMDLSLESNMNQMLWAGESLLTLGRCRAPKEVSRGVEGVSAPDVQRVAKRLFKTNALNLAIVGPASSEKDFSKILSFSRA